ncbi:MAG TPA: nuclear transport factor 2 family protein [Rhodothermales bacterium]|nr:nuclear transport factor 2 family protein [Rhodothermales bacterium]
MSVQETSLLLETIDAINRSWLEGRYSEIAPFLHEDVVFMAPGFEGRIKGRAPCAQSYRDFVEAVHVNAFEAGMPEIQVWGDAAIAACPFSITYEMDGRSTLEAGIDLLVFARDGAQWQVVCRTVSSREVATGAQD